MAIRFMKKKKNSEWMYLYVGKSPRSYTCHTPERVGSRLYFIKRKKYTDKKAYTRAHIYTCIYMRVCLH